MVNLIRTFQFLFDYTLLDIGPASEAAVLSTALTNGGINLLW